MSKKNYNPPEVDIYRMTATQKLLAFSEPQDMDEPARLDEACDDWDESLQHEETWEELL